MKGVSVTETTYRGYTIRVLDAHGVAVYDAQGNHVDSFASSAHARPQIDKWVDRTVR